MADELIQVMLKHLPPSGMKLRLLDVAGRCGEIFAQHRQDLEITTTDGAVANQQLAPLSFDAVVAVNVDLADDFLIIALGALRPGGRMIVAQADSQASQEQVDLLEGAGYTRILVERLESGVLVRGEKPHTEARTVDRIKQVADRDAGGSLENYRGRYVHLLIQQTPNKPIWALQPGDDIEWRAVTVSEGDSRHLLAFSSLPKAIAFMQPAVMQGVIDGVNKVGKFSRETAQTWPLPVMFNRCAGSCRPARDRAVAG